MKYLKFTSLLFVVAVVFATCNVNATQQYSYANIEIPAFNGFWISPEHIKKTTSNQYARKTSCIEKGTGVAQPAAAQTMKKTSGGGASNWSRLGTSNTLLSGGYNTLAGHTYALHIKVDKWVLIPASFSGGWTIDA